MWLPPTWLCSLCIDIWDEVSKTLKRNFWKRLGNSLFKLELICGCVLVSSKIDLIFSMVADMILYIGFKIKAMLITRQCFSCCWTVFTMSQGLVCFSYCTASEDTGVHKKLGRDRTMKADSNWLKKYSIWIFLKICVYILQHGKKIQNSL